MHRWIWVGAAFAIAVLLAAGASLGAARAHEHREVGKYEFTVGFQDEPTYVNQPNGIWVQVVGTTAKPEAAEGEAAEGEHEEGKPVEGLEKSLEAEVLQGDDRMSVPLRAAFGEPGVYLGDFVPTKEGDYRFHFTGAIGGEEIDQTFESGPGRFNSVQGLSALQFPEKQLAPAELQGSVEEARAAAADARSDAAQARTIGYVGVGAGLLGLLTALAALASRRGRRGQAPVARTEGI